MHPGSHDRYQLWRQRLAQKCDQRLLQFVDETHELSKSLVLQFAGAPQTADALQEAFVNIRRHREHGSIVARRQSRSNRSLQGGVRSQQKFRSPIHVVDGGPRCLTARRLLPLESLPGCQGRAQQATGSAHRAPERLRQAGIGDQQSGSAGIYKSVDSDQSVSFSAPPPTIGPMCAGPAKRRWSR